MPKFSFESKAKTLEKLEGHLNVFEIPSFEVFTIKDLQTNGLKPLARKIKAQFKGSRLAVRSSSVGEDSIECSAAGRFDSVLDINASDETEICSAIHTVVQSYDSNCPDHEIIVQKFVDDISMSGVVFTRDINTGAPYFVVNFDDISGSTSSVTSGAGEHSNQVIYVRHNSIGSIKSPRFQILIKAVEELMSVIQSDNVDIEFALTKDLVPLLFQVRPITTSATWMVDIDQRVNKKLGQLKTEIKKHRDLLTHPGSLKPMPVFSQMSDWNPAEIIGNTVRPLGFSLYRLLITDKIWAQARTDIGYSECDDDDLVKNMAGHPFVNVRASFQSLLPQNIPFSIKTKLIDHFVNRLIQNPRLHDKIEFEIIPNVFTPNINAELKSQVGDILSKMELDCLKQGLKEVTFSMIKGSSSIDKYMAKINELEQYSFKGQDLNYRWLMTLIQRCQEGTFAFAALARHGFAGAILMRSLVSLEIFDAGRLNDFHKGFSTVSGDFVRDCNLLAKGQISENIFCQRYGHLRPGTYDILSPRYDQINVSLFGNKNDSVSEKSANNFRLTRKEIKEIDSAMSAVGFNNITANDLINYCMGAIKSREYSKLIFTRFVSEIIENVIQFGKTAGLCREELSFLEINSILANLDGKMPIDDLKNQIKQNIDDHNIALCLKLPPVLSSPNEIDVVPFQTSRPNFITKKKVMGSIVTLDPQTLGSQNFENLNGNMILIENADPGYDWLFSFKIRGLITRYGGANSHMAIRCAEHDIPAAIGCGDHYYHNLSKSSLISLDCGEKKIAVIR